MVYYIYSSELVIICNCFIQNTYPKDESFALQSNMKSKFHK